MKCFRKCMYGLSISVVICLGVGIYWRMRNSSPYCLSPEKIKEYFARASAYLNEGNTQVARALYEELVEHAPSGNALIGLGQSYEFENNITRALACYQHAVEIDPDNALAHIACAGMYFMCGDYAHGFAEYEWRWKNSNMVNLPHRWDGSSIAGKTVLLLSENALGDVIQFLRFARVLKEQGARVVVQLLPQLVPLARYCDYIDTIIAVGEKPPVYDVVTSLQSVPALLHTTVDTLPSAPYMFAAPDLENEWRKKLADNDTFKIGLCWQAGGQTGHVPQGRRSIPLALFAPLSRLKNITFYCLQKGAALEQIKGLPEGFNVIDLGDAFDTARGAFMDTAALMRNLDLVITIDTSVAHLAGALGVPTWMLLPYVPDPRWMLERSDTPWYPSMRLFRQTTAGDWKEVIERVKEALCEKMLVKGRAWHNQKKYAQAQALYEQIVSEYPGCMQAHIALGYYYEKQNNLPSAMKSFQQAVACVPSDPVPHICLSPIYCALGDFKNWMQEYAWRWHDAPKKLGNKWWDGSSLKNKKILLLHDNGLGDVMQYVRYARLIKNQGAQVIVAVPPALKTLFSQCCPYIDSVVTDYDMRSVDAVYPLQLLPGIFTSSEATIPQTPYFEVPRYLVNTWRTKLAQKDKIKIGICWQTPHDDEAVPESKRSIPMGLLRRLAQLPGAKVYSLQKGVDSKELAGYDIENFGPDFDTSHGPFMDTAAIMLNLDLVVTIDTSIAHLAGALGVPVWVLLPHAADVRWMLDRSDTPWYPSMRLFRQKKIGDWASVINEVILSLDSSFVPKYHY